MFTESPIRSRQNDSNVTRRRYQQYSPDDSNVTRRRYQQYSPDDSNVTRRRRPMISMSPDDSSSPDSSILMSNNITRRSNRRNMSDDLDLDALNTTIMQSPEEMDIASDSANESSGAYENLFSIGDESRASTPEETPLITDEQIEEENRRQLARLRASARFDIAEFDTPDKHTTLTEVSLPINQTDITVYDLLNIQETSLKEFLEEDADNIAFKFHTQKLWMGISRQFLLQSVNNPSQIKYECITLSTEVQNGPIDVDYDVLYYNLRGLGFPAGVIIIHDIGAILRDNRRLYELVPSEKVLRSTLSYGLYHFYLPASDKCDPGNETVVYTARAILNTSGGRKKKTMKKRRNHKKQKKSRRTRK